MKVCIGSPGKFHTFDLALQIECRGLLQRLYTAYPRWKVDGLPFKKVASFPWLMGLAALMGRLGFHRFKKELNRYVIEAFDNWMAKRLEPCQVFHCLSSFGLKTHHVAKKRYGALTICDRGSSHIVFQDEILAEEYERWGIQYERINSHILLRELQEYAECDVIAVPSTFAYNSFIQKGIQAEKLIKIPYGVDLSLFHPLPKDDDTFRVIYVGALSLQKGIPYLLEAVSSLKLPKFEVWLIGAFLPEMRPFMSKYHGKYRYFGIIPRTELAKYYGQGSVFVLPSIQEGFGLVQAQAMACGLPVIATTNTGAEDLFSNGVEGFIVPIRDAEAIREKILYFYQNPDVREEMAKAALKRVKSLGGWDSYGNTVVSHYQKALEERKLNHAYSSR